ncbi:MAG: RIP metalloprotease RseP, partial [Oscillospiraceae bacterium]
DEGALSSQTGLKIGDEILAVNGRRCFVMDDVNYEFIRIKGGTADFTVKRDGKTITLPNVTFETEINEDVEMIKQDYELYYTKKTPVKVISYAANWSLSMGRQVFLSFIDLVTGNVPISSLSGPVGIVNVISQAADMGWRPVIMFLALISINLGIFNLIPFPALDGGRFFLLIIEAIRRKPINPKYEGVINMAGFVLLIGLMLFVTFNDVTKLIL